MARRHGCARHEVVPWVRRKVGAWMCVWRLLADGSTACATPCILCSRQLSQFDLRVVCTLDHERCFAGRLSDPSAPKSKETSGQRARRARVYSA